MAMPQVLYTGIRPSEIVLGVVFFLLFYMLARSVPTCWQTRSFPIGQACSTPCLYRKTLSDTNRLGLLSCIKWFEMHDAGIRPSNRTYNRPCAHGPKNRRFPIGPACWNYHVGTARRVSGERRSLGLLSWVNFLWKIQTIRVYGLAIGFFHQRIKDAGRCWTFRWLSPVSFLGVWCPNKTDHVRHKTLVDHPSPPWNDVTVVADKDATVPGSLTQYLRRLLLGLRVGLLTQMKWNAQRNAMESTNISWNRLEYVV